MMKKVFSNIKSSAKSFLWATLPRMMADYTYYDARRSGRSFYGGYDGRDMVQYIKDSCETFLTQEQMADKKYLKTVIRDIIHSNYLYGTNPTEYFCYGFPDKSGDVRKTYLPRYQKDLLLNKQMGPDAGRFFNDIKDKNIFYRKMKPWFRREACRVEVPEDYSDFSNLLEKSGKLICKPTRGGCGSGIEIVSLDDFGGSSKRAFEHLLSQGVYIAEELVEQDPRMADWNNSSINTLRIPVFRDGEGIVIFYPSLRVGRRGSIIDNAGAGGTFAAIDPQTGVIVSDGFDKLGHRYVEHPDSRKVFRGAQIPDWDALKVFVQEMHSAMPPIHKYIAYDIALSIGGWVVIEANWGEISMPQIEFGKGLREEFICLLNK